MPENERFHNLTIGATYHVEGKVDEQKGQQSREGHHLSIQLQVPPEEIKVNQKIIKIESLPDDARNIVKRLAEL